MAIHPTSKERGLSRRENVIQFHDIITLFIHEQHQIAMPKPMLDRHAFALLIERCKNAELNDQIMLLQEINANLPKSQQLQIPSLITGDYVRRALDIIEEIIDSSAPRN